MEQLEQLEQLFLLSCVSYYVSQVASVIYTQPFRVPHHVPHILLYNSINNKKHWNNIQYKIQSNHLIYKEMCKTPVSIKTHNSTVRHELISIS